MYRLTLLSLVFLAFGCGPDKDDTGNSTRVDEDGDGYYSDEDCNDQDYYINPGANEVCADGIDNNCDGGTDDSASINAQTWYLDGDLDGYGDTKQSVASCEQPEGYVLVSGDCNDASDSFHPGAVESDCKDMNDYNCDGSVGYMDSDKDGWAACENDCDDSDVNRNPGLPELCADDFDNDCDGTINEDDAADATIWYLDYDNDNYGVDTYTQTACEQPSGYVAETGDCDDRNEQTWPGAPEVCDELDNDCDLEIDEEVADPTPWYADSDLDGYGDPKSVLEQCEQPEGYVALSTDCDDTEATIHPGAPELCNGIDEDCDLEIDEDSSDADARWYRDLDSDGYGDESEEILSCSPPDGYVSDHTDCDDTNFDINPGAPELCNDFDDNCNGIVDTDSPVDAPTWYLDYDRDGYGTPAATLVACIQPDRYAATADDCDDLRPTIYPSADEYCDGVDTDCDGTNDEDDALNATDWYIDSDSDGYGSPSDPIHQCYVPSGYVSNGGDCDDTRSAVNPAARESCNSIDDNCDTVVDESTAYDAPTWYRDSDSDSYGETASTRVQCDAPVGFVRASGDCDDTVGAVNPGEDETCNGIDDNCNAAIDESAAIDALTWYLDYDGDGHGTPTRTAVACTAPDGYVASSDDCNDLAASAYTGATEICDGIDNDCDLESDEPSAVDATTWYQDYDSDTYGNSAVPLVQCTQPSGYVRSSTDCNDLVGTAYPGATERCNGIDDNCDLVVDEDSAVDATAWYVDLDSDHYGTGTARVQCNRPIGFVSVSGDCDDSAAAVYPGADELCNTIDDNCNGATDESSALDAQTWYLDYDDDGHGKASSSQVACYQPDGYVAIDDDCNDLSAVAYPGADEMCDTVDNDCDGTTDEPSALDASTWYQDFDTDTYGNASVSVRQCSRPTGYVLDSTDCDDTRNTSYPRATEYCNTYDDNCDGVVDEDTAVGTVFWYPDRDGDGYGNTTGAIKACDNPGGYGLIVGDCNDDDDSINPTAEEYCDLKDNDCNGTVDDAYALDATTWYRDFDDDDYGDATVSSTACTRPSGYVSDTTDCDDSTEDVNPSVQEICNNEVDDNCDGNFEHCSMGLESLADTIFTGAEANDQAGMTNYIGDVNLDGIDDIMVSAQYADSLTDSGALYLFHGPIGAEGDLSLSEADAIMTGSTTTERAANSFGGGVDLNLDGWPDYVVSAWVYSYGSTASVGRTYVVNGPITGSELLGGASTTATIRGDSSYDRLGSAVVMMEDSNGDAYGDIAYGAYTDEKASISNGGVVYINYGPVSGAFVSSDITNYLYGQTAEDRIGEKLRGNVDLDGDGLNDLLLGAYLEDTAGSSAGAVYAVYMPVTGAVRVDAADSKLLGSSANDQAGVGVYSAGDFNSDGFDDFLVGAPQNDTAASDAGAVYLIHGPPPATGSLATVAEAIILGESSGGKLGMSVAGDQDIDGDGQNDLLLGATTAGPSSAGAAYMLYGPVTGTFNVSGYDARFTGSNSGDEVGSSVRFLGDVDGTGMNSIGITAVRLDRSGTDAGAMFLVLGVGL